MSDRQPRKGGAWLFIAAGIVVIALVLTIAGLVWPRDSDEPTTEPTPSQSEPASSASSTPEDGACGMPENDSSTVPDDLRWEAASGVTWPVSDSLGPASSEDGLPTCFAHSPVGAALAATSIMFALAENTPADVMAFYAVESPGRDALIAASTGGAGEFAQNLRTAGLSLVGFQVLEYSGDRATVALVYSAPGTVTGYQGTPLTLEWVDGDWRLKPLDDGSLGAPTPARLGQFVEWGS